MPSMFLAEPKEGIMIGPLDHMPGAFRLANARAERWRQRCDAACKERDDAQAVINDVRALYETYMKWKGQTPHPGESSIRQREQLAEALGILEEHHARHVTR